MTTQEQIRELINAQIGPLQARINELTLNLGRLTGANSVTEYKTQTIDNTVRCDETLDVIKSLPTFDGKNSYVSWREAATNSMMLYVRNSRKYYAALTIMRNKIIDDANDLLTNHGTVLNFDAILSRLDFAYADKRPIHIIEQELSIMRQGQLTILEYYNKVNQGLTSLINKTIMTHGTNAELTNVLNNKNRQYALRVFITGLNAPLSNILFSLAPSDLPNALAKAQELESNNLRATFALQFNRSQIQNNNNYSKNQNVLRLAPSRPPRFSNNFQNRAEHNHRPAPEPMEIDSSVKIGQGPANNSYRNTFQQNRNPIRTIYNERRGPFGYNHGVKRELPSSAQQSIRPQQKFQRVNNIVENSFLEEELDCPSSTELN